MKHKLILLNLLLAGVTATAAWRLREDWRSDRQHETQVLQAKVKSPPPPAIVPIPEPKPFVGVAYADVAQKDLFAKDRNPNVIVEPVVAKPEPPMPPLPVMFGVMGLPSGFTALMAEKPEAHARGVRVGESVGAFKVVALDPHKVVFEWNNKKIEKNVDDLVDRRGPATQHEAAPDPRSAPTGNNNNGPTAPPKPGVAVGTAMKACTPGDTSPAGTVADGYRKISEATPFGPACRWVPVN